MCPVFTEKENRLLERALEKAQTRLWLYGGAAVALGLVLVGVLVALVMGPTKVPAVKVTLLGFVFIVVLGGVLLALYRQEMARCEAIEEDFAAQERVFEVSRILSKREGILQQQTDPRYYLGLESGSVEVGAKLYDKVEKGMLVSVQLSGRARVLLAIERYNPTTLPPDPKRTLPA